MSSDRSARPWWQLRPKELAARYDFDPKALLDAVDDPDGISDEQFDLVFRAVQFCLREDDRQSMASTAGDVLPSSGVED